MPMKMEQTECSEMSAHKIQMPGNNPEESVQHLEHSKCLKSRSSSLFNILHSHFMSHGSAHLNDNKVNFKL